MLRFEQRFEIRGAKIADLLKETKSELREFGNEISNFSNMAVGLDFTGKAIKNGTGELELF